MLLMLPQPLLEAVTASAAAAAAINAAAANAAAANAAGANAAAAAAAAANAASMSTDCSYEFRLLFFLDVFAPNGRFGT